MMVEEQFRDLMLRTKQKFELIECLLEERRKLGHRVRTEGQFEFTQLVNSFLLALALPRERDLGSKLKRHELNEARNRWGFPDLKDDYPEYTIMKTDRGLNLKPENLNHLVRLCRNGLLHGNFDLIGIVGGDIERIKIWNEYKNDPACGHNRTWGTTLDANALRQLLFAFVDVAQHLYDDARGHQRTRVA